jgi:hypothetical protein
MAGSLENRGKLRELIDKFKFVELRKSGFNRTNSFYRSIFDGNVSCL